MTFARLPLGPFFCGMALYVHVSPADVQFLQGRVPSPMHLTLRRWHPSQARFTVGGVGDADESAIFRVLSSPREAEGTSTGPDKVEMSMEMLGPESRANEGFRCAGQVGCFLVPRV